MRCRWIAVVFLVSCGLAPASGRAADAVDVEQSRLARQIADDLMSPFCPGRTLYHCPSPNATAVKEEIRGWLAAGVAPDEVRSRLRVRFGEVLQSRPRSSLGWIVALAALALVGLGFIWGLRRAVGRGASEASLDPEEEARLLRELDGGPGPE